MWTNWSQLRKTAFIISGSGVFWSTVYMSYHLQHMEKEFAKKRADKDPNFSFVNDPQRNEQYQRVASCYDDALDKDEFFNGVNLLRRALLRFHASGDVLEVGAGTGRNIKYYPYNVRRVVLTDSSDQMLAQAKQKASNDSKRYAFLQGDSAHLDLPDSCFDCVVDTFGLCSYNDPVAVLKEMERLCKPNGKILLLEHGRSKSWDFVTRHLDKHAEQHAANWGCAWNRDLDAVLQKSGLEIERFHKFHFGTTYYVVCRPAKKITR